MRRKWIDEHAYADLVGLCQFLPGPASSQIGFSIGLMRAGYAGAIAAWTGFTLPSALLLILFAYGAGTLGGPAGLGLLHGLKLVAVAIVAQAVWGMAPLVDMLPGDVVTARHIGDRRIVNANLGQDLELLRHVAKAVRRGFRPSGRELFGRDPLGDVEERQCAPPPIPDIIES